MKEPMRSAEAKTLLGEDFMSATCSKLCTECGDSNFFIGQTFEKAIPAKFNCVSCGKEQNGGYPKSTWGFGSLGSIVMTCGVNDEVTKNPLFGIYIRHCLNRFIHKDFGDIDAEDKEVNMDAAINGGRVLAAYKTEPFKDIWIIREADGSITTVLFPAEY